MPIYGGIVSSGGSSYPRVTNFASLPAAAANTALIYVVENATGIWPLRRAAGLYLSDGVNWNWLGNALWVASEIGFTPAGSVSSTTVQAAVEEVSSDIDTHAAAGDPHTQYVLEAGLNELVDDRIAALLVAGANVTLNYNDAANTLTIAATGGGGGSTLAGQATITAPGPQGVIEWSEQVTATGVTPSSRIFLSLASATDDLVYHPDFVDLVSVSGDAETDAIIISIVFSSPYSGPIILNWSAQ
jgi:hypothetical protein